MAKFSLLSIMNHCSAVTIVSYAKAIKSVNELKLALNLVNQNKKRDAAIEELLYLIGWRYKRVPRDLKEIEILLGNHEGPNYQTDFGNRLFKLSEYRSGTSEAKEFERLNFTKVINELEFDGEYFRMKINANHTLTMINPEITLKEEDKVRSFDSGSEEFRFNFVNKEKRWDKQVLTFRSYRNFIRYTKNSQLYERCRRARPLNETAPIATAVWLIILKKASPKAFEYLDRRGFLNTSTDVYNYIDECKRFTKHIKANYTSLTKSGIEPTLLLELDQMAGFRRDPEEISWREGIIDWVKEKKPLGSAVQVYIMVKELHRLIPATMSLEQQEQMLYSESTYNSPGGARTHSIMIPNQIYNRVKGTEAGHLFQRKKTRLTKTSYGLSLDWQKRIDMIRSQKTWIANPIVKQEVTKVRYAINTDVSCHYQLAPLEEFLKTAITCRSIFNTMTTDDQAITRAKWVHEDGTRLSIDQSSFDHNCSRFGFVVLLDFLLKTKKLTPDLEQLFRTIESKFANRQQLIQGPDGLNTRWESGMLSGYKITNVGDSIFNASQTRVALEMSGVGIEEVDVYYNGDDTILLTQNKIDPAKIIKSLNLIGCVAHPDKTISSQTMSEFLRIAYNKAEKTVRAYPTRMIPSLVYQKPWISPIDPENLEGVDALSRMTNWLKLKRRIGVEAFIPEAMSFDISGSLKTQNLRREYEEEFKHDIIEIELIQQRRKGIDKFSHYYSKGPKLTPKFSSEAHLNEKQLIKWILASSIDAFSSSLGRIKGSDFSPQTTISHAVPILKMKQFPFPRSWVKEIIKEHEGKDLIAQSYIFGMFEEKLKLQRNEMYSRYKDAEKNCVETALRYYYLKEEFVTLINLPEDLIAEDKEMLMKSVSTLQLPRETLRATLTEKIKTFDFANTIEGTFGNATKIYS